MVYLKVFAALLRPEVTISTNAGPAIATINAVDAMAPRVGANVYVEDYPSRRGDRSDDRSTEDSRRYRRRLLDPDHGDPRVTLQRFSWTDRCRPVAQIGVGDERSEVTSGVWDVSRWDDPDDRWSGIDPEWLDVSCEVFSFECEYGRKRTTDRFVPGVATLLVRNLDGWADPYAVSDPAELSMRPGRGIRVGVVHEEFGTRWLFRGFIDAVVPTYEPERTDRVTLSCVDALGEINRAKLLPFATEVGAGETADVRVGRLLDRAIWPITKRDLWPTSWTLVGSTEGGQIADLLGVVADSVGGAIFGDLDGSIAFRPRDWQIYDPTTPIDGTIGNVDRTGSPAYVVSPEVPGYLTPTIGTVTTPDPGPLPSQCVLVWHARGPVVAGGVSSHTVVGQWSPDGQRSWRLRRHETNLGLFWGVTTTGAGAAETTRTLSYGAATGGDETASLAIDLAVGTTDQRLTLTKPDGLIQTAVNPRLIPFDGNGTLRIGGSDAVLEPWDGRIYSVELRTGLDPRGGSVVWRFDASEYPGTGTTYIDPRGRPWTVTSAAAITPKVPAVVAPAVAPDVCPGTWTRPFERADIATRVLVGRSPETAVVRDDVEGQVLYGIEPFERTDLLTQSDARLNDLAERILETRGSTTAPRVRSVSLDARTSDDALDLLSTVDVYRPSRYRCRLAYPDRLVFDDEYFATGVHHSITRDAWTLELNLDLATPYAALGGRWDAYGWDRSLWSDATTLLAEARDLLRRIEAT